MFAGCLANGDDVSRIWGCPVQQRLNGWQRLWVVLSVISLVAVLVVQLASLPAENPQIVSELGDSRCGWLWQDEPEFLPDDLPRPGHNCYALYQYQVQHKQKVNSVDAYQRSVFHNRAWHIFGAILVWAGASAGCYLLGIGLVWVDRGFRVLTNEQKT